MTIREQSYYALAALMDAYRARTGTELEIVVVSDHGHNQRGDAETIDLDRFLDAAGFTDAERRALRNWRGAVAD